MEILAPPLLVDTIAVDLRLVADLPRLGADPYQLQQVLVNLLNNAGLFRDLMQWHGNNVMSAVRMEGLLMPLLELNSQTFIAIDVARFIPLFVKVVGALNEYSGIMD